MRCVRNKNAVSSFGVHGGFSWRKNRSTHDSLRRCPARGRACSAPMFAAWGFQKLWACVGEGLKGKSLPEPLSTQAGRARMEACPLPVPVPAFTALRATLSSRTCWELGFLHPAGCPLTIALRGVWSWRKGHWNGFSFPFWDCSLDFIFSLSAWAILLVHFSLLRCLPAMPLSLQLSREAEGGRPTQGLHPTPVCGILVVLILNSKVQNYLRSSLKRQRQVLASRESGLGPRKTPFEQALHKCFYGSSPLSRVWETLQNDMRLTQGCLWSLLLNVEAPGISLWVIYPFTLVHWDSRSLGQHASLLLSHASQAGVPSNHF